MNRPAASIAAPAHKVLAAYGRHCAASSTSLPSNPSWPFSSSATTSRWEGGAVEERLGPQRERPQRHRGSAVAADPHAAPGVRCPDSLKLWGAESGAERATLSDHRRLVHACAFSPDGSQSSLGREERRAAGDCCTPSFAGPCRSSPIRTLCRMQRYGRLRPRDPVGGHRARTRCRYRYCARWHGNGPLSRLPPEASHPPRSARGANRLRHPGLRTQASYQLVHRPAPASGFPASSGLAVEAPEAPAVGRPGIAQLGPRACPVLKAKAVTTAA